MGGNSLRSIRLASKIHKELDAKIPLAEIFRYPTIREQSEFIKNAKEEEHASIQPVDEREFYAASSAQKRLYILHQMYTVSIIYNMPQVLILEGNIDGEKLKTTFIELLRRHESLRTSFKIKEDGLVQQIHDDVEFGIEYYDLTRDQVEAEDKVEDIIRDFIRPFDMAQVPLLRVGLIKKGGQEHILMVDMHHIITDGTSSNLLVQDFISLYKGGALPELRLHYKDFSQWQNGEEQKLSIRKQKEYWLREFEEEIPVLNLPTDFTRPAIQSFEVRRVRFELGKKETAGLKKIAVQEEATLYMILLAIYVILISKISDQEDIVIGTPTAGRRHADLDRIIGMFVNTLVLRNFPKGEKNFPAFLKEVKERTLEAFENQDYPFEDLVEQLNVSRDTNRNPLFDVMFIFQNMENEASEIPGMKITPFGYKSEVSTFDLTLMGTETAETLIFTLEYSTELFERETAERFTRYFKTLVSSILEDGGKRIPGMEIIPREEKELLFHTFNDNKKDVSKDKTIQQWVEEYAERSPHRIALQYNDSTVTYVTYRQLNERSHRLARQLRESGLRPEQTVGILLDRSPSMVECILATWKASCAYIPIDARTPVKRILGILKDSGTGILFTRPEFLDTEVERFYHGQILRLDQVPMGDTVGAQLNPPGTENDMNRLAYVIYTSGSTGKPKGAMVEHIGMMNHIQAKIADLQITTGSIVAQNATHTFDISIWQFFTALTQGGKTVIYPDPLILDPLKFISRLAKDQVTILEVVPSYLAAVLDTIEPGGNTFATLRYLLVTGEEVKPGLVKHWFEKFPGITMVNAYGPTEASDDITHHVMDKPPVRERIPIGKPLRNFNIYIVDKNKKLCPIGIRGEICVSGIGVGRGYLNSPERTAEAFINIKDSFVSPMTNDPTHPLTHSTIYRTGDIGAWMPDGTIDFFGRKDYQVKIRGFRIETGEIENKLMRHQAVKESVVIDRKDQEENKYLCAYITWKGQPDLPGIKAYLSERLPGYMVPSRFVELRHMPLLPNGKIDRKALPEPQEGRLPAITYITEDMLTNVSLPLENRPNGKEMIVDGTIDESEKEKILYEFNNTGMDFLGDKTIHQLFEEQVEKSPDRVAVIYENTQITYRGLNERANRLAQLLRVNGVKADDIVGLWIERSVEMISSIIAVLKAGGAYLPIGVEYPEERIRYILEDSKSALVLKQKHFGIPIEFNGKILDIQDNELFAGDIANLKSINMPTDLLYIMYTSGSTGKPRGVMVQHNHFINAVFGWLEEFNLERMEVNLLQIANFTFDVSVFDIAKALLNGGKLFICPENVSGDIASLYFMIKKQRITLFESTPSLIIPFMEYVYENKLDIGPLQLLILGSDICQKEDFKKLVSRFGERMLVVNSYGVTEAAIDTSYYKECTENTFTYKNLPIGKPLPNMKFYVLNSHGNLQPIGMAGELLIGGKSVARGYLNEVELTHQRFVSIQISGLEERMYKTGDLARWLADGNMEFLGRMDHQVQIRGIRVEPGEIENILLSYPDIKEAAVVARRNSQANPGRGQSEDTYLWAFIVAKKRLGESQLREHLAANIPLYMLPSCFVQLEKMPLTPNGKLNRKLLEIMDLKINTAAGYDVPKTKLEKIVMDIWKEELKSDEISVNDNFFELGGNSLKIIRVNTKLKETLKMDIPVVKLFEYHTVRTLAEYLEKKEAEESRPASPIEQEDIFTKIENSLQESVQLFEEI